MRAVPIHTVLGIRYLPVNPEFMLTGNMPIYAPQCNAPSFRVDHQLNVLRITHLMDRGLVNAQTRFFAINSHDDWLLAVLCQA